MTNPLRVALVTPGFPRAEDDTSCIPPLQIVLERLKLSHPEIDDMDRFQLYDHLLILGWNRLVALIIEELTAAKGNAQAVVVVADLEEPPPEVTNQVGSRVFFVRGDYTKPAVLEQARVRKANKAIIVADDTIERSDQDRDARTVLGALMVERMNPEIYTCAELLNRENEQHLLAWQRTLLGGPTMGGGSNVPTDTVRESQWQGLVEFTIEANAFLYRMVPKLHHRQ